MALVGSVRQKIWRAHWRKDHKDQWSVELSKLCWTWSKCVAIDKNILESVNKANRMGIDYEFLQSRCVIVGFASNKMNNLEKLPVSLQSFVSRAVWRANKVRCRAYSDNYKFSDRATCLYVISHIGDNCELHKNCFWIKVWALVRIRTVTQKWLVNLYQFSYFSKTAEMELSISGFSLYMKPSLQICRKLKKNNKRSKNPPHPL